MKRLQNKVILVAGGGGIGNALARRYAQEGAHVVLGDNHLDRGQGVAAKINESGGSAVAAFLDGTQEDSIAGAVDLAKERFGGLDGLHANFAILKATMADSDAVGIPLDVYDTTMNVNARGFLLCTRHAVPAMLSRGGGSVVYTSSVAGNLGEPVRVAYGMSKAAVHALMRHVTVKFGPDGVRANVIMPGMVRHEGWAVIPEDYAKQMEDTGKGNAAIKSRIARSEDVASLGALLMSDEGSYITGQVIAVDGGTTMRP
jgi:NAD(P)-dependent dehydrogenase (short-subunit alcohol dehydrogenase family)